MRIVESAFYSDAALSVYMKVKALGRRAEGCTAGIATLARYLGLSKSTVERGIAQLRAVAPDGVVELPDSRRRSLPGGSGTTAQRRVRPMSATERFVWLPVTASEYLRPRLLRAYAVIAHAVIQRIPLGEGELARFLRHHSGQRAGLPITADAAGRIIDGLAEAGWIGVERRAAARGRHRFTVHDGKCGHAAGHTTGHTATETPVPTPVPDDGSGSRTDDVSLANKEDHWTDRPDDERALCSSAVGEIPVVGAVAVDRAAAPKSVRSPGLALRADDKQRRTGGKTDGRPRTDAPALTYSSRIHRVLEPVRGLLPQINVYVQRRIGKEIGRQLRDGAAPERLRRRLTARLAVTMTEDIRDAGRWLLGVALPRWGCADPDCESGILWSTGARCSLCAEVIAERRRTGGAPAAARTDTAPVLSALCCPGCDRPHRAGGSGLCTDCGTASQPAPSSEFTPRRCPGHGAHPCGRPTPTGLCWRCRTEVATGSASAPTAAQVGRARRSQW